MSFLVAGVCLLSSVAVTLMSFLVITLMSFLVAAGDYPDVFPGGCWW